MRSEERSGIVFIVLLLLWGTLITEPFRYFVTIINDGLFWTLSKAGLSSHARIEELIVSVVLVLITIGLLKLSKTTVSNYFAPLFSSIGLMVFLIRCLLVNTINFKLATVLIISVVLSIIIMLMKRERVWIWVSDFFIFSFPLFLISAWILKPIANLSSKASKFLFVAFKSELDFASSFKGFLTLPGLVWGVFFSIVMMLPVIYFVVGRRKG